MVRSRVDLFEQIRRDRRVEALSIRELAERHRVHRRTVRQALASAVPPPRKAYARRSRPAIDPYVEVIAGWECSMVKDTGFVERALRVDRRSR